MAQIVKTEWLKIKNYPAFWWVMGITALTYPGVNYMFHSVYVQITDKGNAPGKVVKILLGNPFSFPEAWRTVAYFSSLFVFIPAIVIIMLITNEYSYKTNRQNIIDGWSREQFMWAKLTDVALMSLIVSLLYTLVTFIIGLTNRNGADFQIWPMSYYIGLFALQTFSQLSLAFLTGFLLRKSFFALSVFCFYFIILEPIAVNVLKYKFKSSVGEFFPLEISQRLLPKPAFFEKFDQAAYQATLDAIKYHVAYTIILALITWGFAFWLNHRRDL